ncbi:MAG: bifunctional riboflavin kinase/FAD synthetase [Limnochordales bacterium]|nr:bifunctional riboflavin kinase/FAD synthetase [Limnochordales bacterium]
MSSWQVINWSNSAALPAGAVLALGTFDGVHRGHQAILARARSLAQEWRVPAGVLTFDPHPLAVLRGDSPELLTTLPEKLDLFARLGMDGAVILQFDRELAELPATDFVEQVLIRELQVRAVVVGFNFTFGRKAEGDASRLRHEGEERGLKVEVVGPVAVNGLTVSSSIIRQLLLRGDVAESGRLLGRPYAVEGRVVPGEQRGRQLGIPTANLALPTGKLLPADGVFAGSASILNVETGEPEAPVTAWPAVISISDKPTFRACHDSAGEVARVLEVHLLDFTGDLYGRRLRVEFFEFLRPIQRFANAEMLRTRMLADVAKAREVNKRLQVRDRVVK